MTGKHIPGGLILAAIISSTLVATALAQSNDRTRAAAPVRAQVDPPSLQVQLREQAVRAAIARDLSIIPLDIVLQDAARLSLPGVQDATWDIQSELESADRVVSRAQIDALINIPAPAGRQASPDNLLPPPRRAVTAQVVPGDRGLAVAAPARARQPVSPARPGNAQLAAPPQPVLDVNGFGEDLHAALRNSVQGYTMRIGRNGQNIYTLQWNWARRPTDGSRGWNPDRRMNIASVSKFITAAAMVDLLDRRNIDPQTSIVPWLPSYWNPGNNADDITFAMLLTHSSGLSNSGSTDFPTMRQMIENGVTANLPTGFTYENTNFGLQRILIATLGGYASRTLNLGADGLNDAVWDSISLNAYTDYVQKNVFAPAGVNGAGLGKDANTALAYAFTGGNAWNSGDLSWRAGSGGWHLSVDEILDVAAAFRYSGAIVPNNVAAAAIANQYGLDGRWNTPAGLVYHKNGAWREQADCPAGQRQEQSLLLIMPGNMEMALLVNSPVGPNCTFLRGLVQQLYLDNIVTPES